MLIFNVIRSDVDMEKKAQFAGRTYSGPGTVPISGSSQQRGGGQQGGQQQQAQQAPDPQKMAALKAKLIPAIQQYQEKYNTIWLPVYNQYLATYKDASDRYNALKNRVDNLQPPKPAYGYISQVISMPDPEAVWNRVAVQKTMAASINVRDRIIKLADYIKSIEKTAGLLGDIFNPRGSKKRHEEAQYAQSLKVSNDALNKLYQVYQQTMVPYLWAVNDIKWDIYYLVQGKERPTGDQVHQPEPQHTGAAH